MTLLIIKKRIKGLFCAFFFGLLLTAQAQTTYYVSNSGSDTNSGTSAESPWQTIGQVNTQTLTPGDSVLFECGGEWRGSTLYIRQSGTADHYITIGSYGEGAKPKILGSAKAENWERVAGTTNVWRNTDATYAAIGAQVFFVAEEVPGHEEVSWGIWTGSTDPASLNQNFNWVNTASDELYVYYDGDMNADFSQVEVPRQENCIELVHVDYIRLNNLELAYSVISCMRETYPFGEGRDGMEVTNCHMHHVGMKGSSAAFGIYCAHSNARYAYNEIHDCGRRSISLSPYLYTGNPLVMTNVVIEHNHFHHGWHTTGVDIIGSSDNWVEDITIRNNYFQGSLEIDLVNDVNAEASNHIFLSNKSKQVEGDTAYFGRVYIYNNIFTYTHGKSVMFENVDDSFVVNNTFYGSNPTTRSAQRHVSLSYVSERNVIKNNIFYNNTPASPVQDLVDLMISYDSFHLGEKVTVDSNLHFAENPASSPLLIFTPYNNSVLVTPPELIIQPWLNHYTNWDYVTNRLDCGNSVLGEPQFVDANARRFGVESSSPAVGAGEPMSWITTDYYGNPRDPSNPTIGAVEYLTNNTAQTDILAFNLPNAVGSPEYNHLTHIIYAHVETGSGLTLSPTIQLSNGSTISPASGDAVDFSSAVVYTVTAADGVTEATYKVVVTERAPEAPPVIDLQCDSIFYLNTMHQLDASGTTSPNGSPLNYNWSLSLPESSFHLVENASLLSLMPLATLAPPTNLTVTLRVNDGISAATNQVTVAIWESALETSPLSIVSAAASSDDGNTVDGMLDGDPGTRWSAAGIGEYATLDLGDARLLSQFNINFFRGTERNSYFSIQASADGTNWVTLINHASSSGLSEKESFQISEPDVADSAYRYIRYLGLGNSSGGDNWNSIIEFQVLEQVRTLAQMTFTNGVPEIGWSPALDGRTYDVEGRASLTEGDWGPVDDGSRYFRVRVFWEGGD